MQTILEKIFALQDECTSLGLELNECLRVEREALVNLKLDVLLNTASQKEDLFQQLKKRRAFFRLVLKEHLGYENSAQLDTQLTGEEGKVWGKKRFDWLKVWGQIKDSFEANHRLIEASQKNMDHLVGHLKQLLGQGPLYSPKGTKVDSAASGKVIQGRY